MAPRLAATDSILLVVDVQDRLLAVMPDAPALIRDVKASGIYVTPTNSFFFSSFGEANTEEAFKERPDYAYIPSAILKERWSIRERYWKAAPPESRIA